MLKVLRSAITIIELLVVLLVVAILAAILLIAIVNVRANSRNLTCQNNLRQMGLAICNYESSHRYFPPAHDEKGFSLHVNLLPILENDETYLHFGMFRHDGDGRLVSKFNQLPKSHGLPVYRCPDSAILPYLNNGPTVMIGDFPSPKLGESELDFTSYLSCFGARTALPDIQFAGLCSITSLRPRARAAEARNGLSQTLAVSEGAGFDLVRLQNVREERPEFAKGLVYATETHYTDPDLLANDCWKGHGTTATSLVVGYDWRVFNTGNSFSTWLPPNSRTCLNRRGGKRAPISPSSHHSNWVNACFGDASVRVVANDIDHIVWQKMGRLAE